jgi:serine/threonine protein kinase
MGSVFRALDRHIGAPVAVKVMDGTADVERFYREARILAELRHPAIVSYVAHGEGPNGVPYLVMEWLEGEDLASRLRRGPLSVAQSLALVERTGPRARARSRSSRHQTQ